MAVFQDLQRSRETTVEKVKSNNYEYINSWGDHFLQHLACLTNSRFPVGIKMWPQCRMHHTIYIIYVNTLSHALYNPMKYPHGPRLVEFIEVTMIRHEAIILRNAGLLLIALQGTHFG